MRTFLSGRQVIWSTWVVGALLLLAIANSMVYGIVVPLSALLLTLIPGTTPRGHRLIDRADLFAIGGFYVAVIGLYRLAFGYFTVDSVAGLFLCFAAGLLVGVAGPIIYTVWGRGRSLRTLGIRADNWQQTASLGFAVRGRPVLAHPARLPVPGGPGRLGSVARDVLDRRPI